MQVLKAGALYFAVVFAAGFVLGTVRTLWIVPRFGTREAELMEAPIMLAVSFLAARWVTRRLSLPRRAGTRLAVGCVGLALLLLAEFAFVLWVRGLLIPQYIASRDPVAGPVLCGAARGLCAHAFAHAFR
jgi:hypothetical protein